MTHDALVIGGGIVGMSTAYHLAQAGLNTLLIDRRHEGRATDAGAGILTPPGNHPDAYHRFASKAFSYYPTLIRQLQAEQNGDTGFFQCGELIVAVSQDEDHPFRQTRRLVSDHVRDIRVGLRPVTPDGLPILGPVPGIRHLLIATGHGATGLQLGPYTGKVMSDLIQGDPATPDLVPFALDRFW